MPIRGQYMTSTPRSADLMLKRQRDDDAALRREFPYFTEALAAAGPTDARLEELAAERRALEARTADIRAKIAAFRARRK